MLYCNTLQSIEGTSLVARVQILSFCYYSSFCFVVPVQVLELCAGMGEYMEQEDQNSAWFFMGKCFLFHSTSC